jgi:hypothetical protein
MTRTRTRLVPVPPNLSAVKLALAIAAAMAAPALAQQPGSASLVRIVTDGKPWSMTMLPQNRQGVLTLNPDGTGRMEGGPMAMTPTWRATPDGLCLKPAMVIPERCVTLRREGAAIVGVRDNEVQFRLTR